MKDGDIDYSKYTLRELEEALEGINARTYPKNHANLRAAYEALTARLPPMSAPVSGVPADYGHFEDELPPTSEYDEHGCYVPNHIPSGARLGLVLSSLFLLAYGAYGVWVNDLYLPGRRGGIHLHDAAAWTMFGAITCGCIVMLLVIIDHYDRRENELNYWRATRFLRGLGWTCFVLSLIVGAVLDARNAA